MSELKLPHDILKTKKYSHIYNIVTVSSSWELFTIMLMLGAPIMFQESYDPFRRYAYNVLVFMHPWLQGYVMLEYLFMLLYSLIIRLALTYARVLVMLLVQMIDTVYFWTLILNDCASKNLLKIPSRAEIKLLRLIHLYINSCNASQLLQALFPLMLATLFVILVALFYASAKFLGVMPFGLYILYPIAQLSLLAIIKLLWVRVANTDLHLNHAAFCWKNRKSDSLKDRKRQKYLKSIPIMHANVGIFFKYSHPAFLAYCGQILDKSISVLLNWP